LKGGKYKNMTL